MRGSSMKAGFLALALAGAMAVSGCSAVQPAGPQSVAGMSPVGSVMLTEITAVGGAAGSGQLTFRGRAYSFKLAGGVTGGGGAADTQVVGDVYNLNQLSDFNGLYTQNNGGIGLQQSGNADLWLRNQNGVVMHLTGVQQGMVFSLGRDEILITLL